jgi:ATP adenylyltransferase
MTVQGILLLPFLPPLPATYSMENLWSPWRYDYVALMGATPSACPFCVGAETHQDVDRLIVHRGEHNFAILNLYPYTLGHLLIVPYSHTATLDELSAEQTSEMMGLTQRGIRALRRLYHPEGFNVGMNLGHSAGAGIREHVHMHVVPRWNGDTSFMPVLGDVKVLPEALERTAEQLRLHF